LRHPELFLTRRRMGEGYWVDFEMFAAAGAAAILARRYAKGVAACALILAFVIYVAAVEHRAIMGNWAAIAPAAPGIDHQIRVLVIRDVIVGSLAMWWGIIERRRAERLRMKAEWFRIKTAVEAGNIELVRRWLAEGNAIDAPIDADRATLLLWAVQSGDEEMVRYLVREGADVNRADKLGRSPLLVAVRYDRVAIERFLKPMSSAASKQAAARERRGKAVLARGGQVDTSGR